MAAATSVCDETNRNESETQATDNIRHIFSTRDFSLNIDRALRRKINGCKQVRVEYECTGGGITGTMDTATFELFRSACTEFYSDLPPEEGTCEIDFSQDKKKKAVVQQTYRFRHIVDGLETGYTVNLYSTNNKLLINGKDIDTLMDRHLPVLHEIMTQGLRERNIDGVEQFNTILAEQMSIIQRQRRGENTEPPAQTDTSVHVVSPERNQEDGAKTDLSILLNSPCTDVKHLYIDETNVNDRIRQPEGNSPEHTKCPICKKNVRKNAAVCQIGKHWIHYRCDKLTETEINRLHNDKGFIYNCKSCSSQETVCKTIAKPTDTINKLKIPECPTAGGTAMEILKQEIMCPICDTYISGVESVCGTCTSVFHPQCMSDTNEEICLACAANELQITETDSTLKMNTLHSPSPHINVPPEAIKVEKSIQLNSKDQETQLQNGVRSKKDGPASQSNSLKQREIRQSELKLRKWEEELKIREAKCTEAYQGVSRLEDYVRKVEARNLELQETIRTLKRKIDTQTIDRDNGSTNDTSENLSYNCNIKSDTLYDSNKLILGVQNQVTNFILRKVAKQIQQLEQIDEMIQSDGERGKEWELGTRDRTQQHANAYPEVVIPDLAGNYGHRVAGDRAQKRIIAESVDNSKSLTGNQESRTTMPVTTYGVKPVLNPQVLPPHLIKSVPPPPFLQGQPLVASCTPPYNLPLNQHINRAPLAVYDNNQPMVTNMAPGTTSNTEKTFLRQTLPQKRRM